MKQVSLPKKKFKIEHKHLVKVLLEGSAKDRKKEAKDQAAELREVNKEN